jgi:hypothetical protein
MGHGRGKPWTEAIMTQWYKGHELARMSDKQKQQMRDLREGRQVGAAGTAGYSDQAHYYLPPLHHPYQAPYPPPPPPQYPPSTSAMQLPTLPLPIPNNRNIGALHQQHQQPPPTGNRLHPDVNHFGPGSSFAHGPPRF